MADSPDSPQDSPKTEQGIGADLSVGELRAVIMQNQEGTEQVVTLAARMPDNSLDPNATDTTVGFFPGLIVVEEGPLQVPVLILFVIINNRFDPPCDLAVNITDANSIAVLERFMAQEKLHMVVADNNGAKALTLGGNPASRQMLPRLIEHAQKVSPPTMPDEAFWNVANAIYGAFNGASGLLALFSNLLNDGQELPIFTFKPSDVAESKQQHDATGGDGEDQPTQ